MQANTRAAHLLQAWTIGIALAAAPALAQSTSPAGRAAQSSADSAATTPAGQAQDAPETDAEASDGLATTSTVSPGSRFIARWVHAAGGRICIGPRIDHKTRISRPSPARAEQGGRVSTPSFANARLIKPPARTKRASDDTPAETASTPETIETTAEPTSGN